MRERGPNGIDHAASRTDGPPQTGRSRRFDALRSLTLAALAGLAALPLKVTPTFGCCGRRISLQRGAADHTITSRAV